jgi:hypothetical protein
MTTQRIDIVHAGDAWVAETGGQRLMVGSKKDDLVRDVTKAVRESGTPTSVVIHGMNGRIQEERTYPRGADPRRSRG